MKLIDKSVTEIVAGYDDILKAETDLRSRWRPALIAAYARRRVAQDHSPDRKKGLLIAALAGVTIFLIGLVLSCSGSASENTNALIFCCGGPLLSLLGLLIAVAAGFANLGNDRANTERVPLHPLRDRLLPDLRQAWLQGLSGDLKTEVPDYPGHYTENEIDYGAEGERLVVSRLEEVCCQGDLILARLMQRRGEDVDVILVSSKGLWVFEVKHWSGEIYWDEKGWRRVQRYYARGGIEVAKELEVGEPPDQQWVRAAAEVTRTLQYRVPQVLTHYPELCKVRGGIIFSKENAELRVQPGRQVFWGPLNFWLKTIEEIEPKADLDTRSALQIVEALLERHHELGSASELHSMRIDAQHVVQMAEEKLAAWVTG
jgi:Holliday junction resolvase-like predicted endonuclease